jgi:hypothetical protein
VPKQESFFTKKDRELMMDNNVPELLARQRIRKGWSRKEAMTMPIVYKTAKERNAEEQLDWTN